MVHQEYERWLAHPLPGALRSELEGIRGDEPAIHDRFYTDLAFGTGGLRGVLGAGTNRMNELTVGRATQGFADYLNSHFASPAVAIAYDSRHKSGDFARRAACVFAGNGIKAYLFEKLAPTPVLSFAVRRLGCDAGVVITASHNPPEYNGYKAYNSEGCQLSGEACEEVYAHILETDLFEGVFCQEWEDGLRTGMIEWIGAHLQQEYLETVCGLLPQPGRIAQSGLSMVYTPLNGAGGDYFLQAAQMLGISGQVQVVAQQRQPDGDFPTCPYPNPEMPQALQLAVGLARQSKADLVLATDPDADRVGCAVREGEDYQLLTGNQVGFLLTDYLARARRREGQAGRPLLLKSLVSSPVADRVAAGQGAEVVDLLPGFKYIGDKMTELEKSGQLGRFLLGFEESCGYLAGGYIRDKDGVAGALLIAEMAAYYKEQGQTLAEGLQQIYSQVGYCLDRVESAAFPGAEGMRAMQQLMQQLRENPPAAIGGQAVEAFADYQRQLIREKGAERPTGLPKNNILAFWLQEGDRVIVRPSGTEPKLKMYLSVFAPGPEEAQARAGQLLGKLREQLGL